MTGADLKRMRTDLAYTQGMVAQKLIVDRSTIWRWERAPESEIPIDEARAMLQLWKKSFPHVCPWCGKLTV